MPYKYLYNSPISPITLMADDKSLMGLYFTRERQLENLSNNIQEQTLPIFKETCHWLDIYFSGKIPNFTPALSANGTEFQREVWKILLTIPYGKTMTYGEIAKLMAKRRGISKMSPQAVGGAVGKNPISIIIPCHRVIGSNGNLTGYAAGLDKKIKLLEIEKII